MFQLSVITSSIRIWHHGVVEDLTLLHTTLIYDTIPWWFSRISEAGTSEILKELVYLVIYENNYFIDFTVIYLQMVKILMKVKCWRIKSEKKE